MELGKKIGDLCYELDSELSDLSSERQSWEAQGVAWRGHPDIYPSGLPEEWPGVMKRVEEENIIRAQLLETVMRTRPRPPSLR